ncbi:MAG: intein-containing adenosylcobalamin-dependent ribonucleoside-diphosphate reductase, partial [Acidobacteria bacterium]|nr:intein-containing adenosylcobalamin-dependent ribonucleoside-diphosphate reductase [Acidobacteriota bacterium]
WFNVGCDRIEPNSDAANWHWNSMLGRVEYSTTGYKTPQCSACFINSIDDSLDSILTLAKTEGMLFKWGSGTGTNLSPLRSSTEQLSGGGTASGPLSFMKGFDAFAGVIKSGGKTRRAAKMVILNADHPDIVDFIESKAKEEAKAHALVAMGYDGSSPDSEAYSSIFFQNANNSVRVTEDFMYAVIRDSEFSTKAIRDGRVISTYRAKDLLRKIAEATWKCGDPGMQFDTTINRWHTSKNTARINASNPCVTGETLVATGEGWQRIDSLVGRSANVFGSDGQLHAVREIFPTGTKQVFCLRTRAGFQLRLTADHRVLTATRGDVATHNLLAGDQVVLGGAGFGRIAVGSDLALALGIALGDGYLTRFEASGGTQEIITLVVAANEAAVLEKIAGEVSQQKPALRAAAAGGRAAGVSLASRSSVARLSLSSRPVVDLFKQFTVLDEGSDRKRFTNNIFKLDQASLAIVLRGLFTTDATIANYGDNSRYISLDSRSEGLLRQVQLLLLSFGIKANLYSQHRGGQSEALLPDAQRSNELYPNKEVYSLQISRSWRFIFEREIGFDPASPKAEQLQSMNREFAVYEDSLRDVVESIEAEGEEPVFDLSEPATSHFLANGLVVHNCSEYMFLDDSACNLASLNLLKFAPNGSFDVEAYRHAVDILITAQEIIVDNAGYPTEMIARNSHDYRPLGLGYANLGALLMACGLSYDSEAGRDYAASVTAIMCGEAYLQSSRIAELCPPLAPATPKTQRGLAETNLGRNLMPGGACAGFYINREPFLDVIRMHRASVNNISRSNVPGALYEGAKACWDEALAQGEKYGYRNSQVTVLAPTGTIGFMMDCDTTGIEPDLALVKYKKLVGGGMIKIVNQTVPTALFKLGYSHEQTAAIVSYIDATGTIEGAPHINEGDLAVFDCSFKPAKGTRFIHYMGHLRMMAATQPFISGAISKTVNLPEQASVDEIMEAYIQSWKLGLKAVAIYRDGCKKSQPLSAAGTKTAQSGASLVSAAPALLEEDNLNAPPKAVRHKLKDERASITHKFNIAGHEGYITVGLYENGEPGEIFITMAKEGSTVSGLMDSFALATSIALQHGVPLKLLCEKFAHTRFEPSGWTNNAEIGFAKSIMDYIFRWLHMRFLTGQQQTLFDNLKPKLAGPLEGSPIAGDLNDTGRQTNQPERFGTGHIADALAGIVDLGDAPSCHVCGSIMVRNGSCYKCMSCGSTSGCS